MRPRFHPMPSGAPRESMPGRPFSAWRLALYLAVAAVLLNLAL